MKCGNYDCTGKDDGTRCCDKDAQGMIVILPHQAVKSALMVQLVACFTHAKKYLMVGA